MACNPGGTAASCCSGETRVATKSGDGDDDGDGVRLSVVQTLHLHEKILEAFAKWGRHTEEQNRCGGSHLFVGSPSPQGRS